MQEEIFEKMKSDVLGHMQNIFEEMEGDMKMAHQEKYTLLEDSFGQASDADELRVAFEQWYQEHSEDLELEHSSHELWEHATVPDDDDDYEDDEKNQEDDDDDDDEEVDW